MSNEELAMVEVLDIAWDEGENHLMVSFAHGKMGMIDFNGFGEGETEWKFIYERVKQGNHGIIWKDDRSGDFLTYSRKLGVLR